MYKLPINGVFNEYEEAGDYGAGQGDLESFDETVDYESGMPVEEEEYEEAPAAVAEEAPQETMVPMSEMMQYMQSQQQQTPQQAEAPPMSQEQIDELLHTVRVDTDLAESIFGSEVSDNQIKALQNFADAIIKNSTTVGNYALQHVYSKLNSQFSPALDMARETRDNEFFSSVTGMYPALEGHEQTMKKVLEQLRQSGYTANSGAEAAQIVAGQTESLIRSVNPQFSLQSGAQNNNNNGQQGSMPSMASLGGGAGGGQQGAQGGRSKVPTGLDIFS